jgi:hypothetical protein
MRICGRHIVLFAMASLALAGCGGGDENNPDGGSSVGNLPPVIAGTPIRSLTVGTPYNFTPTAADPDGDALTFIAENVPAWATFNSSTGALTGTPTSGDVGTSGMITIGVSDSKVTIELPAFNIQVMATTPPPPPTNVAPTIAGTPATSATVGQVYTFTPVGQDANGDSLTYTIQNRPSWATFTPATGQLTGTPASGNVGTTLNVVISVSDGRGGNAALAGFNLTVSAATPPPNRAPTISGTPPTSVTAGSAYSFTPVGADPDGNSLQYSIQGQPSWATFSQSTGRLSGTPAVANVGTSARITITVSDGSLSASLASFTIQVNALPNRAPTITGTPPSTVLVGSPYSFQPVGADLDSNPLTYTVQGLPAWLQFSQSSGLVSGTPGAGDVGTTGTIVITVSDGIATASLSFTVTVQQAATGSATVSWTPPTTNTDGSALTDLASYRVSYGRSTTNLNQTASVNVGLTTYRIDNLTTGTWYFAVYAINSRGLESDISNIASKTIQ